MSASAAKEVASPPSSGPPAAIASRLPLVFATALGVWYVGYVIAMGAGASSDAQWYLASGKALLLARGNVGEYLLQQRSVPGALPVLYLGYTAFVAAAEALFGSHAVTALLIANAIALAATALVVMRVVWSLTANWRPVVIAALFFAVLHDQLVWTRFVLTDTIFSLLALLSWYSLGMPPALPPARRGILCGGLTLVWRPTGVLIAAWLALAIGVRRLSASWQRASIVLGLTLACGLVIGGAIAGMAAGAAPGHGSVWELILAGYRSGSVIDARPETSIAPGVSAFSGVLLVLRRFALFFSPTATAFSGSHAAANIVPMVPIYALSLVSAFQLRNNNVNAALRAVIASALLLVGALAAFYALAGIDFDWRYRSPCWPPLILVASLGAHLLMRRRAEGE